MKFGTEWLKFSRQIYIQDIKTLIYIGVAICAAILAMFGGESWLSCHSCLILAEVGSVLYVWPTCHLLRCPVISKFLLMFLFLYNFYDAQNLSVLCRECLFCIMITIDSNETFRLKRWLELFVEKFSATYHIIIHSLSDFRPIRFIKLHILTVITSLLPSNV